MSSHLDIRDPKKRYVAHVVDAVLSTVVAALGGTAKRNADLSIVPIERIAVLRLDQIGDVVMSTPVYRALRERFPGASITAVIGPWAREVVVHNPHIDEVLVYAAPWWGSKRGDVALGRGPVKWLRAAGDWLRLVRELRQRRLDLIIDLGADLRQIAGIVTLSGAQYRLSYQKTGGAALLTHTVPYQPKTHEIQKNLALLRPLGIENPSPEMEIWPPPGDDGVVARILSENSARLKQGYVVVHPGARSGVRRWPPERFATVSDWINERYGLGIVLVGGPEEVEVAQSVARQMRTAPLVLAGSLTLGQTVALLHRGALFVGNESGVMHLAAAVGSRMVVLYGPMDPAETRPLGGEVRVIFERFSCCPCLQKGCLMWSQPWGMCMDTITVDTVREAIAGVLNTSCEAMQR